MAITAAKMTRNELRKLVPIRRLPACDVVAFGDIPEPWRAQFFIASAGRKLACSDAPLGPCAHADDWLQWVSGESSYGPTDLDETNND